MVVCCNNNVLAINEYINFYNITMNDEQKNNLISLGFSEEQIYYMEEDEFDKNKDLQGIIVSEDTKYIKSTYIYKNNDISLVSGYSNFNSLELINVINEEVTEEEYNNSDITNPLSAYGSYQYSVKSISLDLSLSFEVNINGSVGGVFSMNSSISEKFDKMSGTHAQILNPVW